MKTAIVYHSRHHENTRKLLDAIAARYEVTLIDATQTKDLDLTGFDLVGFASGIYYSKFQQSVLQFVERNLPRNKPVFFLYTYGIKREGYTRAIEAAVLEKSATVKGAFGCPGFNTFGPFKLIGGLAKGHPDQTDLDNAVRFFGKLVG